MNTVSRVEAAAFAVNVLGHKKTQVSAAFGTSPRTLGRWIERLENDRKAKVLAELDAQFEGKVSRRKVYIVTDCQRTGRA